MNVKRCIRAEASSGSPGGHGDFIGGFAPDQPWPACHFFFLGVDSSAMVSDGVPILETGQLALTGLLSNHFELTRVANHNLQPAGITQGLILLQILTHLILILFQCSYSLEISALFHDCPKP